MRAVGYLQNGGGTTAHRHYSTVSCHARPCFVIALFGRSLRPVSRRSQTRHRSCRHRLVRHRRQRRLRLLIGRRRPVRQALAATEPRGQAKKAASEAVAQSSALHLLPWHSPWWCSFSCGEGHASGDGSSGSRQTGRRRTSSRHHDQQSRKSRLRSRCHRCHNHARRPRAASAGRRLARACRERCTSSAPTHMIAGRELKWKWSVFDQGGGHCYS